LRTYYIEIESVVLPHLRQRHERELMFNDFIGFGLDPILNQGAKMRYMFGGKAKIPFMSSAIGRNPVAADPTAALNVICSEIGVSITRLRLYFLASQSMEKDENVILIGTDVSGGAKVEHIQDDDTFGGV
jgi:hypothetical protein